MKKTLFILTGIAVFLVGLVAALIYIPVPTSEINPRARAAALQAIISSQSITLESAEYYMGEGRPPHNMGMRKTGNTETKNSLVTIFSDDPKFMFPILGLRSQVMCFIPRHRIICHDSSGSETSIFICFECGNFSVGAEGPHHGMYGYYKNIKHVFAENGFEIEEKKKESNRVALTDG